MLLGNLTKKISSKININIFWILIKNKKRFYLIKTINKLFNNYWSIFLLYLNLAWRTNLVEIVVVLAVFCETFFTLWFVASKKQRIPWFVIQFSFWLTTSSPHVITWQDARSIAAFEAGAPGHSGESRLPCFSQFKWCPFCCLKEWWVHRHQDSHWTGIYGWPLYD